MNKKSEDLKKIPSNMLSRSVSLLNLTVSAGTRYAGLKLTDFFATHADKDKRFHEFLHSQAHVLVHELGRLKGSIMKAGQLLSVYGEHFFPPEVNRILKALQADSRRVSWTEMRRAIVSQLGEQKFQQLEIDETPLAAASLGQVYKARIKATGEILALKVQYPGVDKAINSDLRSLKTIFSISHLIPSGSLDFDEIFAEIRMMLNKEIDYLRELESVEAYQIKLSSDPRFIVPKTYREFTTKRLLALSYENGLPLDSDEILRLPQETRNRIGAATMELMFREIFEWRMVQTDPHFGNYKVRFSDDGKPRIVLFDFGAVRVFPKRYIEPFAKLVFSSIENDAMGIFQAGVELGFLREDDNEKVRKLFAKICFIAAEGFEEVYASPQWDGSNEGPTPYAWGETKLIDRLAELTRDAIFTFKLRTPPREAIFLDRKMVGTYTILSKLMLRLGPRDLLTQYLEKTLTT